MTLAKSPGIITVNEFWLKPAGKFLFSCWAKAPFFVARYLC